MKIVITKTNHLQQQKTYIIIDITFKKDILHDFGKFTWLPILLQFPKFLCCSLVLQRSRFHHPAKQGELFDFEDEHLKQPTTVEKSH